MTHGSDAPADAPVAEVVDALASAAESVLGVARRDWDGRGLAALGGSSLDAARLARILRSRHHVAADTAGLLRADDLGEALRALAARPAPDISRASGPDAGPATAKAAEGGAFPLSWQQRMVWYQSVLDPDSPRYHFHALFRFAEAPSPAELDAVLAALVERHPVMRVRVDSGREAPEQRPVDDPPRVRVVDTDLESPADRECLVLADANRAFDLTCDQPLRWTLIRGPGKDGVLVHTEHHLVHDGESFNRLLDELDRGAGTSAAGAGYLDYAARQQPPSAAEVAACADRFTHDFPELFGPPAVTSAPDERPDTGLRLPLPRQLAAGVRAVARRRGKTLFTVLFAAYARALAEATGNRSLVLGTALGNRPAGHEETVGMFVATALVPIDLAGDGEEAGQDDLDHVEGRLRDAVDSVTDLTEVVEELRRRGVRGATHPGAAFSMYEQAHRTVRVAGREAVVEAGVFGGAAKFAVNAIAVVGPEPDGLVELLLDGQADRVGEDGLWHVWTLFVRALTRLAGLPAPTAGHLPPLPSVPERVREVARDRGGLRALGDRDESFSYADLVRLGDEARAAGVSGRVVGLLSGVRARYWAYAAALMDAGATYLPLDVGQPVERMVSMLRQTGCTQVLDLTTPEQAGLAAELRRAVPGTSVTDWSGLSTGAAVERTAGDWCEQPAYVLFTSGSTGRPKGVAVGRQSLARVCDWSVGRFGLEQGTVVSQLMSVGFDYSGLEVWPALTVGGDVRVVPVDIRLEAEDLVEWLTGQRVEVTCAPTPIAEMLLECDWPQESRLRSLMPGGDRLHPLTRPVGFDVVNLYGPTECTIVSTGILVDQLSRELPPIGMVLDCARHRVVDVSGRPVRQGSAGELWIGGGILALGYWGNPEATAQRFVPDPFDPEGALVYRTGDIVMERADGALEYLGRRDRQLKVSGARVELGEVELAAMRRPEVRAAVAVAKDRAAGGTYLELHVVPEAGRDRTAVLDAVRGTLPSYLRHTRVVLAERLPLNVNGKVDVTVLTSADAKGGGAAPAPDPAPLLDAARAYLVDHDLEQSWFELGGSSLDAAQLVSQLRGRHGVAVELRDLLLTPSVGELLRHAAASSAPAPAPPVAVAALAAPVAVAPVAPPVAASAPTPPVAWPETPPSPPTAVSVLWPALQALDARDQLHLAQRLLTEVAARL
jgi:amino acid adenylation domain-containing protein